MLYLFKKNNIGYLTTSSDDLYPQIKLRKVLADRILTNVVLHTGYVYCGSKKTYKKDGKYNLSNWDTLEIDQAVFTEKFNAWKKLNPIKPDRNSDLEFLKDNTIKHYYECEETICIRKNTAYQIIRLSGQKYKYKLSTKEIESYLNWLVGKPNNSDEGKKNSKKNGEPFAKFPEKGFPISEKGQMKIQINDDKSSELSLAESEKQFLEFIQAIPWEKNKK